MNQSTEIPMSATIYRMVLPDQTCPHGLKAKQLLERKGYQVKDVWLDTREAIDTFKNEQDVSTTPQIFIDDHRIGGHDALRKHLGLSIPQSDTLTYRPVIAIFVVAALIALAISWSAGNEIPIIATFERFIAISMCFLGVQKLQDIEKFSSMFLSYDLLAQRDVRYGYVYPFIEVIAGVLMLANSLLFIAAPAAFFAGLIGAVSVYKAVYVEKRELKCACVGGNSNVPLGFVSLTENLMMMVMGLWMLVR
jgi:glutaredoxin